MILRGHIARSADASSNKLKAIQPLAASRQVRKRTGTRPHFSPPTALAGAYSNHVSLFPDQPYLNMICCHRIELERTTMIARETAIELARKCFKERASTVPHMAYV